MKENTAKLILTVVICIGTILGILFVASLSLWFIIPASAAGIYTLFNIEKIENFIVKHLPVKWE